MYGCLPGVRIGFDPVTYSVEEGLAEEVCACILSGTLEIDAIVTLSSSNGETKGRYVYIHAAMAYTLESINQLMVLYI